MDSGTNCFSGACNICNKPKKQTVIKFRCWFVSFNYQATNGIGNGNLGFASNSFANRNYIKKLCYDQSPEAMPGSVVITNFIEMTEEDYNEFWGNK